MIFIYFGRGTSGLLLSALITLLSLGIPSRIPDAISIAFQNFTNLSPNAGRRVPLHSWFVDAVATKCLWGVLLVAALVVSYLVHKEGERHGLRVGAARLYRRLCQLVSSLQSGNGNATGSDRRTSTSKIRGKFDQVVEAIQQLPLEVYMSRHDLEGVPLRSLKAMLVERGLVSQNDVMDKETAISSILAAGGSSSSACGICCEDYQSDDLLRVLSCRHRFHVACVDQWFLSCSKTEMHVACPLCHAPLLRKETRQG